MNNLKSAFKPVPERFSYSVRESIKEAEIKNPKKTGSKRGIKVLAVFSALLIAVPCGAFAVTKIYSMIAEQVGSYGVELNVEKTEAENSPEYVKLKVDVPKGFKTYIEGIKYFKTTKSENGYISLWLLRPNKNNTGGLLTNIEDYKQTEINGHSAVIADEAENPVENGSKQINVYFENVNIILGAYIGSDVTEKEAVNFLKNVQIVKGTKNDCTEYNISETEKVGEEYSAKSLYIPEKQNKEIDFGKDSYTVSLSNVKISDNVKNLDKRSFYFWGQSSDEYINSDGTLKPREREKWKWGDGVNTKDEKTGSVSVAQKFVLVDITYKNNTDKTLYNQGINVYLKAMQKKKGVLGMHSFYSYDPNADDGCYQYKKGYVNRHKKDNLYIFNLKPRETKTFTVGFRCDSDMIDNAYFNIDGTGISDIKIPAENKVLYSAVYFSVKVKE